MFVKFNELLERWLHRQPARPSLTFPTRTFQLAGDSYQLRQATMVDVEVLVAIEAAIYGVPPWNAPAFAADLKRGDRLYLLMKQGTVAVGLIGLAIDFNRLDGHVTNLAVLPSFQHRGLGRNLMRAVIAVCRAQQLKTMSLEVRVENLAAQRLYEQLGFTTYRRMRRYYLPDGGDALSMTMALDKRKEEDL